ncbi:hypothetical protein Glove_63g114 [Diversispora epigaea]|uniref:Uncharacterized protein n=1 Tax=Diversispora epigaea TaxID=1348612 RepID=A0A397JBA6_9GLOM|nr:hypothetical protein Glove_63g114 [Diversispora epigaea]
MVASLILIRYIHFLLERQISNHILSCDYHYMCPLTTLSLSAKDYDVRMEIGRWLNRLTQLPQKIFYYPVSVRQKRTHYESSEKLSENSNKISNLPLFASYIYNQMNLYIPQSNNKVCQSSKSSGRIKSLPLNRVATGHSRIARNGPTRWMSAWVSKTLGGLHRSPLNRVANGPTRQS